MDNETELITLKKIEEGTAGTVGKDFFRALVKALSEAIGIHGVWITELLAEERRLRALAFWVGGRYVDHYEYDIEGTPCKPVLECTDIFHVPDKVIQLYPGDPDLKPLGAVSYMGVALRNDEGQLLGHLAVLDNKPMPRRPRLTTIFRIFAARAAAELQRLRYEKDLQEGEQRLHRLVNGTHDAIIELDERLQVTQMNKASKKLFGVALPAPGLPLKDLLTLEGLKKVTAALLYIREQPAGDPHYWIQGYLGCRASGGHEFPAEATITAYSHHSQDYYVLILRSVHQRLAAEQQIKTLSLETELLRRELNTIYNTEGIIGNSPGIISALKAVQQVAPTGTTVLLTGETGTGKELFARAIHAASGRSDKPMIKLNCAALPASLIESELFGHEKGAFTGALTRREGKFALADKGTIFLDEIGELPLELQAKLLRVLQEGEFDPVGSSRTVKVDVRIIAATNRKLKDEVRAGRFREDLYYRLHVFPICIPPLRERHGDIIQLAEALLHRFARQFNKAVQPLTAVHRQQLLSYHWPGNVRELQNVIERAVITSTDGSLALLIEGYRDAGTREVAAGASPGTVLTATQWRDLEKENILRALAVTGWKVSGAAGAAALLDLPPSTLNSRIKALGITRSTLPLYE